MPRHKKPRCVSHLPNCTYFKPAGIPAHDLDEVILKVEEMEAIRLKDLLGLEQVECAEKMEISRPTFQRILIEARRKLAEVLIEGKCLRVEGGAYDFNQKHLTCPRCDYSLIKEEETRCPKCDYSLIEEERS